uniref:Uncharacterized protein n=1 Tax=Oryza brachyantha TaxID=4533 RepID=J3NDH3_ORYBR
MTTPEFGLQSNYPSPRTTAHRKIPGYAIVSIYREKIFAPYEFFGHATNIGVTKRLPTSLPVAAMPCRPGCVAALSCHAIKRGQKVQFWKNFA